MKLTLTFLVIAVILVGILIRGINRMVLEGHNRLHLASRGQSEQIDPRES